MNKVNQHNTYRIGDAIAVTQHLEDGTWIATFPGFIAYGAAESDALSALAAEVESVSKRLRIQAIEIATPPLRVGSRVELPLRSSYRTEGDTHGEIVKMKGDAAWVRMDSDRMDWFAIADLIEVRS